MASTDDAIREGLALQQAGQWPPALACYLKLLAREPKNAHVHFLAGVAEAYCGRLPLAIDRLKQALVLKPDFAEALQALGGAYLAQGNHREAAHLLEKAKTLLPNSPSVHYELAAAYMGTKQFLLAIECYKEAIALKPDYADAYNNLGNLLKNQGKLEEAELAYDGAIKAAPSHAQGWYNLGIVRQLREKPVPAIEAYQKALSLAPDNHNAENNLGLVLRLEDRLDEAIAAFQRAIALKPDYAKALINLGVAYQDKNRLSDSIALLESAVALVPKDANALCSYGNALIASNRPQDAIVAYKQALAIKPNLPEIAYNIALAQLVTGDFEHGWVGYDTRTLKPAFVERYRFNKPRWTGKESLEGKTILLFAEQGLGDTLQFIRYVPRVARLAERVIVRVQAALKPLLGNQPEGVLIISPDDGLPSFHYQCPLLSLPLAFETRIDSIPSDVPYLKAPPLKEKAWREVFSRAPGLKVGLVWSGNPRHQYDHNRSIPISQFLQVTEGVPAHFFVVQKDIQIDDAKVLLRAPNVTDLSRKINDFTDTAAIVSALDLVVTVDTSVAHLAGGLGTPTWNLISFAPDWRWLLGRSDSPWYPSVRLFRQESASDWTTTLKSLNKELMALAERANAPLP